VIFLIGTTIYSAGIYRIGFAFSTNSIESTRGRVSRSPPGGGSGLTTPDRRSGKQGDSSSQALGNSDRAILCRANSLVNDTGYSRHALSPHALVLLGTTHTYTVRTGFPRSQIARGHDPEVLRNQPGKERRGGRIRRDVPELITM
jgi:hypothetical protein